MSKNTTHSIITDGAKATEDLAARLARCLKGGEIIELVGDVGSGKNAFTRGLALGLESSDVVTSPTFTIYNVYNGRLRMYHYDLYRLPPDADIMNELAELIRDNNVVVLEWAGQAKMILPVDRIVITLSAVDTNKRSLKISVPDKLDYVEVL